MLCVGGAGCHAAACAGRPPRLLKRTAAPEPAADFEKGFIRAETVAYDDFVACGGLGPAKDKGLLRLEGKEYVVNEGDILAFRHAS
jgi:ribosome-binding ATPase YchF (GTP1/OBG family)